MVVLSALLAIVFISSVSVIYTTTRLGIPPMPSNMSLRATIVDMVAAAGPATRIVDLGAGWGGLARRLAVSYPQRQVEAVEISWIPLLFAKSLSLILGPGNLSVRYGNIAREKLDPDCVYVTYLSPAGMERVAEAFASSHPSRFRLVSAAFALPGNDAVSVYTSGDLMMSRVYRYEL